MPIQDYNPPIVSSALPTDQPSTTCPSPLTPPPEDDGISIQSRPVDSSRPDIGYTSNSSERAMYVSNNSGHGMIASQEEALYYSQDASPDSTGVTDIVPYPNERDKLGTVQDESTTSKAASVPGHLDSPLVDMPVLPPSPLSLPRYSPKVDGGVQQPSTTCGHDVESDLKIDVPFTLPRPIHDDHMQLDSWDSQEQVDYKGTKVDQELDWASTTSAWDFSEKRLEPRYPSALFRYNSRYEGTQQSDRQVYNVNVRILTVDMTQCTCTGYLTIKGLTPEHDTLQTYFTGEIIGGPDQRYSFRTKTAEWGASDRTDLTHWARFPAWRTYAAQAKKNLDFSYPTVGENWWQQDNIFMRWKEHFLVPDHKTKSIAGASFEGFYYICLNQIEGRISGIYFHSKSEKYQQLELKHEGSTGIWHRGVTPSVEFR